MIRLVLTFFLAVCVINTAHASGAKSPEALAMTLVNAYRDGDVNTIVGLYYFIASPAATIAAQQAHVKMEWRKAMRQYLISGYRVSNLSGEERQSIHAVAEQNLTVVKKLLIRLTARHEAQSLSSKHYIANHDGRYSIVGMN